MRKAPPPSYQRPSPFTPVNRFGIATPDPTTGPPLDRASSWTTQLRWRMHHHPLLKGIGTTVFMTLFFVGYFHVLRHPVFPIRQMPLTAIDRWIGFYPPALLAYVSLWFYVGIPPALLLTVRELIRYGLWIGALCSAGLLCFLLWPTAIAPPGMDIGHYPGFQVLAGVDAKANACPSLHVATAVFSAIWLDRLLAEMNSAPIVRRINWLWFALIAYSTLATKQHVALDVAGGLALGSVMAWLSLRGREAVPSASGRSLGWAPL